jgi:site-specific DNA-methyltransferase (adenine-specific)
MEDDGLSKSWAGENTFINPPYSQIGEWVTKAYWSSVDNPGKNYVLLIPVRTDTKWFHDYIIDKAAWIYFIKGRLKFDNPTLPSWKADGSHKVSPAPFPSMIVYYNQNVLKWNDNYTLIRTIDPRAEVFI